MLDLSEIIYLLKLGRFLRPLLNHPTQLVRHHLALQIFMHYHWEVVHRMRTFALTINVHGKTDDFAPATAPAKVLCGAMKNLMALLGVGVVDINCCLKLFLRDQNGATYLTPFARSDPEDGRSRDIDKLDISRVAENTILAALLGGHDGITDWRFGNHTCFSCNDLSKEKKRFKSHVRNWDSYYNSIVVFTLRYISYPETTPQKVFGILQFDSPEKNAFKGLPNTLEAQHSNRQYWHNYKKLLHKSAIFHAGASMADSLSMMLLSFYETMDSHPDNQKPDLEQRKVYPQV